MSLILKVPEFPNSTVWKRGWRKPLCQNQLDPFVCFGISSTRDGWTDGQTQGPGALQKWLNRSSCRLGCGLRRAQGTMMWRDCWSVYLPQGKGHFWRNILGHAETRRLSTYSTNSTLFARWQQRCSSGYQYCIEMLGGRPAVWLGCRRR